MQLRKPVKPITENQTSVASVSSIDHTAISAVDLAIATSVEKEVQQGVHHTETKPEALTVKQPKVGGGKLESPKAAVSALDHVGVSSVDLDIAASVEKEVETVIPAKVSESSEKVPEKEERAGSHEIKGVNTRVNIPLCVQQYVVV